MKMITLMACGLILGAWRVATWPHLPPTFLRHRHSRGHRLHWRSWGGRAARSCRGIIAAAIPRPVVAVLVGPGDRVTKGQALIKLFDLEPQAKLRAREQELKSIEAKAQASRRNLDLAKNTLHTGAIPQTTYNELRGTARSNDALVLAAQAEVSLAQSELTLYTVTASIDGEVAWMDVSPGTVTWPGSLIWGEIVDLRELDVRCEVSPVQADQVAVGQSAEIRLDGKTEAAGTGKVVFVAKAADRNSGLVPVVVRVANSQGRLRRDPRQGPLSNGPDEMISSRSLGNHSSHHQGCAGRPGPGSPGPDRPDTLRPGPGAPGGRGNHALTAKFGCATVAPPWCDWPALRAVGCGITASPPSTRKGTCAVVWMRGSAG